jgi:hypothetical protein
MRTVTVWLTSWSYLRAADGLRSAGGGTACGGEAALDEFRHGQPALV